MSETWLLAALWLGLALIPALVSIRLRIATALSQILAGMLDQFVIAHEESIVQPDTPWIKFLAGSGAIPITFLAGAELDPAVLRVRWKRRPVGLWPALP